MALRASAEASGHSVDLSIITDADAADSSRLPDAEVLLSFTDAVVRGSDDEVVHARARLLAAVGVDGLVDAAGAVGTFQCMDRIADSTGIPLDTPVAMLTEDLQQQLGLRKFASAGNTPDTSGLLRAVGSIVRPIVSGALRAFSYIGRG